MMLTTPYSNARLRGTSSKGSSGKGPASPVSEDGRLNSPGGLSHRSKSSSNLSASKLPPPSPISPASPLPPQSTSSASIGDDVLASYRLPTPVPMWLNPAYAKHIVRGNFMTLSSRPKTVEPGEWMAHQGMPDFASSAQWPVCFLPLTCVDSGRTLPQSVELCPRRIRQGVHRQEHLQLILMPAHVGWAVSTSHLP